MSRTALRPAPRRKSLSEFRSRRSPSTAVLSCLPLVISEGFDTDSEKSPFLPSSENDEKSDLSRILFLFCRCVSLLCLVSSLASRASRPPGARDTPFLPPLRSGAHSVTRAGGQRRQSRAGKLPHALRNGPWGLRFQIREKSHLRGYRGEIGLGASPF